MRAPPSSRVETLDLATVPATRHQGHAQPRQPGGGVPLVADPGRRRRSRPHGVRRQQPHQGPSDGAGPLRHAEGRGGQGDDRRAHRRLRRQDGVFRRPPGARARPDRGRALSEAGHRADERLQDQRIRQPDRRRRVRAEGGEPDDRLPRRVALLLAALPRGLRARMPGDQAAPRGDGLPQRHRHDPVLPLDQRGRPGARGHGRERPQARRGRARGLRHVRDPLERDPRQGSSPSASTASRSDRTI